MSLRRWKGSTLRKCAVSVLGAGMLLQIGSCQLGDVTTTSTVAGRDLLLQFLRAFLIAPIDAALVNAVDGVVDNED